MARGAASEAQITVSTQITALPSHDELRRLRQLRILRALVARAAELAEEPS